MSTSDGYLQLQSGQVFVARITGAILHPNDVPGFTYEFPRWYTFEPTDPSGTIMPGAIWTMDFDACRIKMENQRGPFAARNLAEIRRRDQDLKFDTIPVNFLTQMMIIRPPRLYDVDVNCTPIINPGGLQEGDPPLFAFDAWVDPESTYCDCEEGEPCPPDEVPVTP